MSAKEKGGSNEPPEERSLDTAENQGQFNPTMKFVNR